MLFILLCIPLYYVLCNYVCILICSWQISPIYCILIGLVLYVEADRKPYIFQARICQKESSSYNSAKLLHSQIAGIRAGTLTDLYFNLSMSLKFKSDSGGWSSHI